jgi:tetratricopeptide (TPR) repeat protein
MASNQTIASTPPSSKAEAGKTRSHHKSTTSLRRGLLFLALIAVLLVYAFVVGMPKWRAYVIGHADAARLRAMCADSTDVAACIEYGRRMVEARSPQEAIDPLHAAVNHLAAHSTGVTVKQRAALSGTLAEALMLAGRGSEANAYFADAIKMDDECVPGHLAFAFWLEGLHNNALAKNELKIVTTLDPRNGMGWFLLAHIYNGENTLDKARDCAQKAIAINPKLPNYWQELGDSYGYAGRFRESFPAYRQELQLDPTSITAQADMARALALGADTPAEYAEAVDRMTTVMHLKDLEAGPAYYLLGTLHLKFGHYQEARAALEKCVRYDGSLPENFYNLSMARKMCGDTKGAAQAMAHFNTMETHYRHTQTLQKQISERPNEPDLHVEVAREWEWYHNWSDALREYQKAAKLKPNDAQIQAKIQEIEPRVASQPNAPVNPAVARLMNVNHAIVLQETHGTSGAKTSNPTPASSGKP